MKIPVDKINIGVRQRIDLGDLTDLDSIADKEVGLICPIIVHKTLTGYELVDGMRRLTKAKQLGWTEIEVFEKDTLTVAQKELCEFFADVARKDRTWQEQATAMHKLYHILRFEKREEGQAWTVRSMEKFCGASKTEVHYNLKVAEALLVEPKDEELWSLDNLYNARKLLLSRANKSTTAELERRRMVLAQANATVASEQPLPMSESGEVLVGPPIEPSPVPILDNTGEAPPVKIKLFGFNHEYFGEGKDFKLAIVFKDRPEETEKAWDTLADSGYLVCWAIDEPVLKQFTKVYWNSSSPKPSFTPFYDSTLIGYVIAKARVSMEHARPVSGNFTCMDFSNGKELERLVTQSLVQQCTHEGETVLCLSGVNPLHVAEIDRVPVFYEPDPVVFAELVDQLKEEYSQRFANVEFL